MTAPCLPAVPTEEALDAFMADSSLVDTALLELQRRRHRLEPYRRFSRGSVLVAASGDEVIKVFPPNERSFADIEWAALTELTCRLPIATPQPRERFDCDGWHGIAMSRLEGTEAAEVWPTLSLSERVSLGRDLGVALGVLHSTPAPSSIPTVDWTAWTTERKAQAVETQRRRGCSEAWLEQLDDFLDSMPLPSQPVGWLHTEVMLEHLLLDRTSAGWTFSGIFDFEPSWVAPIAYELPSIGLFVSRGETEVFRAVLDGLGVDIDPEFSRRCLAMAIHHRYCKLSWYAERIPLPEGAPLEACAERWFST